MLRLLHKIITGGICDEFVRTPVISVRIPIIWLSVICRYHIQRLTLRVSALLDDLLPEMRRYPHNILHKLYRIGKHLFIHPLQDYLDAPHSCDLKNQKICIVDMPASIRAASYKPAVELKVRDNLRDLYR